MTMLGDTTPNVKNALASVLTTKAAAFDMMAKQNATLETLTRENAQLNTLIKKVCDTLNCEPDKLIETATRLQPTDKPAS